MLSRADSLLVTGGTGLIGANFIHYWLAQHPGDRMLVLDALTYTGNLEGLGQTLSNPHLTFVHGDIATPGLAEGLLRDYEVTWVVHLAAESHVDRSIAGPEAFFRPMWWALTFCSRPPGRSGWTKGGAAKWPGFTMSRPTRSLARWHGTSSTRHGGAA